MGVRDEIFPADRDRAYVQTEWASGWAFAVIGFGYAARMLTEQRQAMHANVDQIGLAVFFLQRHRVELVIKQTLVDLGEDPARIASHGHNLKRLWETLGSVVRSKSTDHWKQLSNAHADFLETMHEADEGSFSYRYPTDKDGNESKRAAFISLEALERHADDFENGIQGYTDWLSETQQAG